MQNNNPLSEIRKEIDAVDDVILRLLGERKALVETVKKIKSENGIRVRDINREESHIRELLISNSKLENPLQEKELKIIFQTIMLGSVLSQTKDRLKLKFNPFQKHFCTHCGWNTPGLPSATGEPQCYCGEILFGPPKTFT